MAAEEATGWADLRWGPWPDDAVIPASELDERTRAARDLPRSIAAVRGDGVVQRQVFDPALQQYSRAMRAGEPQFASADVGERWHAARRQAVDHVLTAVAGSRWAGHLVLRGSTLLRAWYGALAREPGDVDFVVTPPTWDLDERRTQDVFTAIARGTRDAGAGSDVRIDAAGVLEDEIWTYDRIPGRRMVLPWRAEGLPSGSVQVDFVFNERMPCEPEFTDVPRADGTGAHRLLAATRAQSLAWKVMWLLTDTHPQGKDLYDAALLARDESAGAALVHESLVADEASWAGVRLTRAMVSGIGTDWEEFAKEYPRWALDPEGLLDTLVAGLEPVFAREDGPPVDGYALRRRWLAGHVEACRAQAARGGVDAVLGYLDAHGMRLTESVVVVCEVVGPDRCSREQAVELITGASAHARDARNAAGVSRALSALREQV